MIILRKFFDVFLQGFFPDVRHKDFFTSNDIKEFAIVMTIFQRILIVT